LSAKIAATHPDLVIHASGYTDVDGCERNPDTAFQINAIGTRYVAAGAAKANAKLLYLSTDYVFDGLKTAPYTERDPVNPLNVYGRSKLAGEEEALKSSRRTLVLRTSWLYGVHGKNFVKTILSLAVTQPEVRVVDDQRGSPTYARHLAQVIAGLIRSDVMGVIHAGGEGECSRYEFAKAILQEAGLGCRVVPISTAESGRLASRPSYSALSTAFLHQYGLSLPPWREGVRQFLADRHAH
ncbi:MAG TPA: dTDP-4-dehydrorhamnose reductase, partial [Nitrospiraceae bacterium]|nr:dTDP-4-dehydrorhamnose reductase [Nitrospiraceae bacterium]